MGNKEDFVLQQSDAEKEFLHLNRKYKVAFDEKKLFEYSGYAKSNQAIFQNQVKDSQRGGTNQKSKSGGAGKFFAFLIIAGVVVFLFISRQAILKNKLDMMDTKTSIQIKEDIVNNEKFDKILGYQKIQLGMSKETVLKLAPEAKDQNASYIPYQKEMEFFRQTALFPITSYYFDAGLYENIPMQIFYLFNGNKLAKILYLITFTQTSDLVNDKIAVYNYLTKRYGIPVKSLAESSLLKEVEAQSYQDVEIWYDERNALQMTVWQNVTTDTKILAIEYIAVQALNISSQYDPLELLINNELLANWKKTQGKNTQDKGLEIKKDEVKPEYDKKDSGKVKSRLFRKNI